MPTYESCDIADPLVLGESSVSCLVKVLADITQNGANGAYLVSNDPNASKHQTLNALDCDKQQGSSPSRSLLPDSHCQVLTA